MTTQAVGSTRDTFEVNGEVLARTGQEQRARTAAEQAEAIRSRSSRPPLGGGSCGTEMNTERLLFLREALS